MYEIRTAACEIDVGLVDKWNKISVSGHAFLCLWKCKYTALRGLFHWYPTASSCLWLYKSSYCAASSERSNKFLPARVVRGQQLFHPLLLLRRIYRRCCLLRPRSRVLLRWRGSSASCTRLITLVLVSMAAYLWYMTVLAMLLHRGGGGGGGWGGGVTTRRCMQFSLLRPPPLLSAKLCFKRGGVTTREYGSCQYID